MRSRIMTNLVTVICLLVIGICGLRLSTTTLAVPDKDGRSYYVLTTNEKGEDEWETKCYCTERTANCKDCEEMEG